MIRFIVVDDDKREIERIVKLVNEIVKEEKEILTFTKLNDNLKEEIHNVDLRKVYILDIELSDKVSGIHIAKLIREVDWESEIIFTTNHDKMFESVHRSVYEVFDFIEKFHNFDARFKKDIREIMKRNFDNKMFIYKTNTIELNLYYKSILYIYMEDRKLVIVTDNNQYRINFTIKDIISKLDSRFKQCHRSCIVNKNRVCRKNYKEGYFTLDTGEDVYMLSKKFKKDLENG